MRVAGSGHSFSDIACTDGLMLSPRAARARARHRPLLGAGARAGRHHHPRAEPRAWPSTGSRWRTSATSTRRASPARSPRPPTARARGCATSPLRWPSSSSCSPTARCSSARPSEDAEAFRAARVSGSGALGVIAEVTLRCVPAFTLRGRRRPRAARGDARPLRGARAAATTTSSSSCFPHTDTALTRTNNRTDEPPRPRGRARGLRERRAADQPRVRPALPRRPPLPRAHPAAQPPRHPPRGRLRRAWTARPRSSPARAWCASPRWSTPCRASARSRRCGA